MGRYALIKEGVVQNVIVADYTSANKIATNMNCQAVNAERYPIQPQDEYIDGEFKRGEVVIQKLPSEEEKIASVSAGQLEQDEYLMHIDYRVAKMELGVE